MTTRVLSDELFIVGRKEDEWAVYSSNADLPHPLYDGAFGVDINDPVRYQPHVDGSITSAFPVQDIRDCVGPMEVGMYPDLVGYLLDWALRRDSNQDGESYSWDLTYPGIRSRRFFGAMVNTVTFAFAEGGDFRMSMDVRAKYADKQGSIDVIENHAMQTIASYYFANAYFLLDLGDGNGEIVPVGLDNGSIVINNNLKFGPHIEDRTDIYKDATIEWLAAGRQELSGSITVLLERDAYFALQDNKNTGSLRLMLAHRSGSGFVVDAAGASAGDNVQIPLTATPSGVVTGSVLRFDTAVTTHRSVGTVCAVGANSVTVKTLDQDVVSADRVYTKAIELFIPQFNVGTTPKEQTKGEFVKVTLNLQGIDTSGDGIVQYQAKFAA